MMTRKHFNAIAAIFADCETNQSNFSGEDMRRLLAQEMALFCKYENGNFDRQRFLDACEVTQ